MTHKPDSALAEFCRNPYPDEFSALLQYRAAHDRWEQLPVRILNTSAVRLRFFRVFQ